MLALDSTTNEPSKFKEKNWTEINTESRGTYKVNSQVKFQTLMLNSSLCDCIDAYLLVKGNYNSCKNES